MASSPAQNLDPNTNYESPYDPTSRFTSVSPQPQSLKRTRSDEDPLEDFSKRQRVEPSVGKSLHNDEFARLLAQATANTHEQIERGRPETNYVDNQSVSNEGAKVQIGYANDPYLYMRILSLPILESLSTQILSTLARGPYSKTIKIITEPESELGQAYATLKSLFDQTKKIYSQSKAFLSADELNIRDDAHRATIRSTNLATFVASVFGGQDVGFFELNDHFVRIFSRPEESLSEGASQLFLNLKTQMYLSVASQEEQEITKEDILDDLFPPNSEDLLMGREIGMPFSKTELDLVEAARNRKQLLTDVSHNVESIQQLSEKFAWEDFLRNLGIHLTETYEPLLAPYMKRHALKAPSPTINPVGPQIQQSAQQHVHEITPPPLASIEVNSVHDISAETQRAIQATLQSMNSNHTHPQYHQNPHSRAPQQYQASALPPDLYVDQYGGGNIPYPSQTAPTQVLYERARQAAVAKSNPGNARRPGLPSQRRPWTHDEENALMSGLDQVKGPHWSQILALYGPNGQINDLLRDRNQVQLKDKARNLKLFFLKSNIEVPYYLQSVTGELKTRAPSQAARKEAEEQARLATDDEQQTANGTPILTNGTSSFEPGNDLATFMESPAPSLGSDMASEDFQVLEPEKEEEDTVDTLMVRSPDEVLREQLLAANASENGVGQDLMMTSAGFATTA